MANRKATFAKRQRETDLKDRAKAKDDRRSQKRGEVRPDKGPQIAWDEAVHAVTSDELPSLGTGNQGRGEAVEADPNANNPNNPNANPDAGPGAGAPEPAHDQPVQPPHATTAPSAAPTKPTATATKPGPTATPSAPTSSPRR